MRAEGDLFARLPEAYAAVLRLRDEGFDEQAIANALGFEVEAIGPLVRIAEHKLARLMSESAENSDGTVRRIGRPLQPGQSERSLDCPVGVARS